MGTALGSCVLGVTNDDAGCTSLGVLMMAESDPGGSLGIDGGVECTLLIIGVVIVTRLQSSAVLGSDDDTGCCVRKFAVGSTAG